MPNFLNVHRDDRALTARLTAKARSLAEAHLARRKAGTHSARRLWPLFTGDDHA